MRAHFGLPTIANEDNPDKRPPIQVKFTVPFLTCSGLQIRYLKVLAKEGYEVSPWVRYCTVAGDDKEHKGAGVFFRLPA